MNNNQDSKGIWIDKYSTVTLDPKYENSLEKVKITKKMITFLFHIYILASTRSGKSELIKLILLVLALSKSGSIVLFDPHGDLAIQCAKHFNEKEDIIFIDPTSQKSHTPTINPFRLRKRDEETISTVAQEIVNALESIIGVEFTPNMEVLLTPLIYTLLRKGDSGFDELVRFLNGDENSDLVQLALNSPNKAHRDFMSSQFSKDKFTVTKNALATKLQILLNNPIFYNFITGKSTIDLEKALNNNKIIIFRLPKGKMRKTLEPIGKLILALIQGIVFKRSDIPKHLRPKTYLLCDEYQNFFGQISDEMLSESAKNNLSILGAHQYLSQLDVKSRDSLMSNTSIKIVGRSSNKDLKIMSEELEVDIQSLKNLQIGEFFIKIDSDEAFKIKTTDKYIDDKSGISEELWKSILKYQKKKYYKKIDDMTNEHISNNSINAEKTSTSLPIPKFGNEEE
jgi:DNA helicase HerA-like ATPase